MKNKILIALGITCLGWQVLAAPNFGGSWAQDTAKSDHLPEPLWLTRAAPGGRGGGRAGGPGGRGNPTDLITVRQDADSLQITDASGTIRKYKLDGKPYSIPTETGMEKAAVTASLQGDTLVVGTVRPYGGMPGNVTLQIKEVWSLSPDGKTLNITTTQSSPAVDKTFEQIYNRK